MTERATDLALRCTALCAVGFAALASGCGEDEESAPAQGERAATAETAPPPETSTATGTATEPPEKTDTVTSPPAAPQEAQGEETAKRSCGTVAFVENSDAGAFEITATGVPCETARAVASESRSGRRSYQSNGFSCSGAESGGGGVGLASVSYTCTAGERRITFSTS